jgi:hypothetical protein
MMNDGLDRRFNHWHGTQENGLTTKKRRTQRKSGETLRVLRFFVVNSLVLVSPVAETMIKA